MSVRPGILRFPVFVAGLLCASVAVSAENPEKAMIAGTIVLEDGSPAPVKGEMSYSLHSKNSGVQGSSGRFGHEFQLKLAPGTLWLTHYAEGFAPAWAGPIQVEAGKAIKDVKIVLKKGFTQRLKITDVDGQPIPGVKIVAHPEINGNAGGPIHEKTADEEGEYLYEHLADTKYVFHLKAPGFQPLTSDPIELEPDAVLPVNMRRAHPCTGVILNADGTPAASAKIRGRIEVLRKGSSIQFGSGEDGFWGTVLATADEEGRFVLDQLRDGADYLLVIETTDKARAVVHDLQAGKKDLRIKVPKRRDVRIAVTGDLSDLSQRSGKPFVAVRQRISFQPFPDYKYGDRIGEDAVLVKSDGQFTATIRGLAVDLNPDSEFEDQEVEVSISYSRKLRKKVPINRDDVTRVDFDLTKQPDE